MIDQEPPDCDGVLNPDTEAVPATWAFPSAIESRRQAKTSHLDMTEGLARSAGGRAR